MKISRDKEFNRSMIIIVDTTSVKSDFKLSLERSTNDTELVRTSLKRKVKHDNDYYKENHSQSLKKVSFKFSTEKTTSEWKQKVSVLAHITFSEVESPVFKKRNLGNSSLSDVNGPSEKPKYHIKLIPRASMQNCSCCIEE